MLRRLLLMLIALLAVSAAAAWWWFGAVNAPVLAATDGDWDKMIRERIKVPDGYSFQIHARGLGSPRLMVMTASGDLLVSDHRNDTITLVKADRDGNGESDGLEVLARGLAGAHGLVLEGAKLFVAEETGVVAYDFDGRSLANRRGITAGIPGGAGHSTRTLKRGPDGFLYLSIGSSCNACIEEHPWRAAIIRFKEGGEPEIFARGLRNTVGFDWEPGTGLLYGVDNGRDRLGDDVPDDEVNLIARAKHYGWPYVHGSDVADPGLHASRPAGFAPEPQYHGLGGHVAPLALRFIGPGEALITEHGSWNRSKKAGYRIVRLSITSTGPSESVFLSGCEENEQVICRPVDIVQAPDGALYVTDDYAGAVYRITKAL